MRTGISPAGQFARPLSINRFQLINSLEDWVRHDILRMLRAEQWTAEVGWPDAVVYSRDLPYVRIIEGQRGNSPPSPLRPNNSRRSPYGGGFVSCIVAAARYPPRSNLQDSHDFAARATPPNPRSAALWRGTHVHP